MTRNAKLKTQAIRNSWNEDMATFRETVKDLPKRPARRKVYKHTKTRAQRRALKAARRQRRQES